MNWWKHQNFILFIAAVLFILLSTIHWHGQFNYTFSHFLIDYNFGFIKRGLIGSIYKIFYPQKLAYKVVFATWLIIILGILYIFFRVAKSRLLYSQSKEGSLFLLFLISSPLFLRNLTYDFLRLDSLLIFLSILGILSIHHQVKYRYIFLNLLIPFLLFTHEASLFLHLPFLLCTMYYKESFTHSMVSLILTSFICCGVLFLFGNADTNSQNLLTYMHSRSPITIVDITHIFSTSLFISIKNNILHLDQHFSRWIDFLFALFILNTLHKIIFYSFLNSIKSFTRKTFYYCCLIPYLSMFFLGIDWSRWISNFFIMYSLSFLILLSNPKKLYSAINLSSKRIKFLLICALLLPPVGVEFPNFGKKLEKQVQFIGKLIQFDKVIK